MASSTTRSSGDFWSSIPVWPLRSYSVWLRRPAPNAASEKTWVRSSRKWDWRCSFVRSESLAVFQRTTGVP